jgi:hypothetical protein
LGIRIAASVYDAAGPDRWRDPASSFRYRPAQGKLDVL